MAGGRMNWDNDLTKIFLDLCIAEKEKLNFNCKKGLTKLGWQNIYRNFRQQTGSNYDRKQLQNKFNSLKRLYSVWRKLRHNAIGGRCDNTTGTTKGNEDWWKARIADDREAEQLCQRPLAHQHELSILFGTMDTEEGDILCADVIGYRRPSRGSEVNRDPGLEDNVSRSGVGCVPHRSGKEQVVDSQPAKKTKVERILQSMLQRSMNEISVIKQEQEEVMELLQVVEEDGVDQGSVLYFIAAELFRSAARRAAFRSIRAPENRIAWLRWTWDNACKK